MKFFVFLFVIAAALAGGYFLHPHLHKLAEEKRPRLVKALAKVAPTPGADGAVPDAPAEPGAPAVAAVPADNGSKVADVLSKMQSNDPVRPAASNVNTAPEDEFDLKYPMPKFREITTITKDWTFMPSTAFPRRIKVTKPVVFELGGGKATIEAGGQVSALAMNNAQVTIARSLNDTSSMVVPLEATNLKELMTKLYTEYTQKMMNRVLAARKNARDEKQKPAAPPVPTDERVKLAGAEPQPDAEGRIPEMMASMLKGDVTEIKTTNIVQWGPVGFHREGNRGYWTCVLMCRLSTIFGEVDTEVTAWMANGKVERWFFTGSKEPVN
jgi:hypothetical protein